MAISILGFNVWSYICERSVSVGEAMEKLAEFGLPEELLRQPTQRRAFSRAMWDFNKPGQGLLARRIKEDSAQVVCGVVHEDVDLDEEELEYAQVTTARFGKSDGVVMADGEHANGVLAAYDRYRDVIIHDDIRDFTKRLVAATGGFKKRPTGGIYFCPASAKDQLMAGRRFVARLGFGTLYVERVINGSMERVALWDSVETEVRKRISDTIYGIDELGNPRHVERRNQALNGVREFAEKYETLLGEQAKAERIAQMFEQAASKVASQMRVLRAAEAEEGEDDEE